MAKQFNQPLPTRLYESELFCEGANRGLIWSRFFEGYNRDFSGFLDIKEATDPKTKQVNGEAQTGKSDFVKLFNGKCSIPSELVKRTRALVESRDGMVSAFQCEGRFVTGMGNDHPTENGFTWHPTLGAPYLPASSVKGLVRGWIEWNGADHAHFPDLRSWFGSQTKSEVSEQAGWFTFFDALPSDTVQLAADVMTPHYAKWYEKGGGDTPAAADTVPADWHSPVPVTFLTVKKATFQFGIAVRAGLSDQHQAQAKAALPNVMAVLRDALEWAGAGAKTATGYGRMTTDEKANKGIIEQRNKADLDQREKQRQLSLAALSPNQRAIEELRAEIEARLPKGKIAISDAFWGGRIKKLALEAEQSGEWSAEEKSALADMLQEWAGQLVKLDAKDLRKQLKLAALRGQV